MLKFLQEAKELSKKINDITLIIGKEAEFSAKVAGVDNDVVVFTINGVTTKVIANVTAMTYTVVASFAGNDTHFANSTTQTYVVNKTMGEIVSVDAVPVFVGTNSTIVVRMAGNETGFVVIEIDFIL